MIEVYKLLVFRGKAYELLEKFTTLQEAESRKRALLSINPEQPLLVLGVLRATELPVLEPLKR